MSGARLAGWLFADLLLVMVVVALGGEKMTEGAGARIRPELTAGPTSTPAPSLTPAIPAPAPSSPAAPAGGLDPDTESITVRTDPEDLIGGSDGAAASIRRQVVQKAMQFQGERAAFVIVFGNAGRLPGGAVDTRSSTAYAEAVAKLLPAAAPDFFPPYDEKIIRSYHNTDPGVPSGTAEIELFFLLH
ncbi:hypothetical protein OG735_37055 [Streptomyces sp. NBC_01210]|uniref:hypothetical protein n=1 Tax=Streptomyces sp. NBC_01210 TaxID=2903774 RepID=UPI002E0DC9FF|nr:hypothetical protein OG735_37055 [Streptomyces sp. NBC_01210]